MYRVGLFLCILLFSLWAKAQQPAWKKITLHRPFPDSLKLDTATIPEDRWHVQHGNTILPKNFFKFNLNSSVLHIDSVNLLTYDSITIYWLPLNLNMSRIQFHKDSSILQKTSISLPLLPPDVTSGKKSNFFETGSLAKSGSFTRGITIGNRQDPGLTSSFNLSLQGKLTDDLEVSAFITDNKLPVQPEGTTAQIQEIDNILIQLKYRKFLLSAGDIEFTSGKNHFLRYQRKVQGIRFQDKPANIFTRCDSLTYSAGISFSRGQYAKITLVPIEGNQGPYRLYGRNNEMYIIVLAGTERVYLDGEQLQRGQENDYVINYNTAEITFTNRVQIRSNSRIVVEFQYVDRFYNKFLFTTGIEYRLKRWTLRVSSFEERDMKNQPIEPLSDTARKALFFAGDSLQNAFVPGIRVVPFQNDLVLYAMKDSLGHDSVFYYSTNPDSARYLLYFSYVGQNKGNYVPDPRLANGKVYRWVSPINGVPQGSYEPIIQLIAPQKSSMWSVATIYQPDSGTTFSLEYARSNRDINTLSPFDDKNNQGNAIKLHVEHFRKIRLLRDSTARWQTSFNAEATDSLFTPVEKFLPLEFERNWSLLQNIRAYQLIEIKNLFNTKGGSIMLHNATLRMPGQLLSNRTTYHWLVRKKRWNLLQHGSYVTPLKGKQLPFYQYRNAVSVYPWKLKFHILHSGEIRKKSTPIIADTNQFRWNEVLTYVQNADTNRWMLRPYYKMRLDEHLSQNLMKKNRHAHEIGLNFAINHFPQIQWQSDFSYLWFPVKADTSIKSHFLQMKHQTYQQYFKGFLTFNFRYQNSMGRENKKEFFFLEVTPGQGTHTWIDYNQNGIKELNEFLLAQFQDQANYIKLLLPTTTYQTVYYIVSSGDITLDGSRIKISNKSWKWVTGLRNNFSFQINNKNTSLNLLHHFLPIELADSFQIFSSQLLREQISFRSQNGKTSIFYLFLLNNSAQSYFYGADNRSTIQHQVKATIQTRRSIFIEPEIIKKIQKNLSVVSFVQNYELDRTGSGLTLSYQRSIKWRTSIGSSFEKVQNLTDSTQLNKLSLSIEHRHSFSSRGNLSLKFLYQNAYDLNKTIHPYLEYTMLEGYKVGKNYAWEIMYMRRLDNNMELTFMYSGRALPHERVVHTGSAQIRILF